MSQLVPLGVVVVHQYYPGFIDLPDYSRYFIETEELCGMIDVLEHVRPLVVTDFNNKITSRSTKDGKVFHGLQWPITKINRDAISADGTGHEGRSGTVIVVERHRSGRVFYQDIYTSLNFYFEFFDLKDAGNLSRHRQIFERFIGMYRFLYPDTRTPLTDGVPDEATSLRTARFTYNEHQRLLPFRQRIAQVSHNSQLNLTIVNYNRGARSLQDHAADRNTTQERAENITSYLDLGLELPESLIEIERLADLAFVTKRPRSAVVEAMSILEVSLIEELKKTNLASNKYAGLIEQQELTWKKLINSVLPHLLKQYDDQGRKGELMKHANSVLSIRHKVVHEGYTPSKEEVNEVLSFIRFTISIFRLPDAVKPSWKAI